MKSCQRCGRKLHAGATKRARFCSDKCRHRTWNERTGRSPRGARHWCRYCGEIFVPRMVAGPPAVTCSSTCRRLYDKWLTARRKERGRVMPDRPAPEPETIELSFALSSLSGSEHVNDYSVFHVCGTKLIPGSDPITGMSVDWCIKCKVTVPVPIRGVRKHDQRERLEKSMGLKAESAKEPARKVVTVGRNRIRVGRLAA